MQEEDDALKSIEAIYDDIDALFGSGVASGKHAESAASLEDLFAPHVEYESRSMLSCSPT